MSSGQKVGHVPVDDGTGICSTCSRRVAIYAGKRQHRRGVRPGSGGDGRRGAKVVRQRCRLCRRLRWIRIRCFTLVVELDLPNVVRRQAGRTFLCEDCWRRLTA